MESKAWEWTRGDDMAYGWFRMQAAWRNLQLFLLPQLRVPNSQSAYWSDTEGWRVRVGWGQRQRQRSNFLCYVLAVHRYNWYFNFFFNLILSLGCLCVYSRDIVYAIQCYVNPGSFDLHQNILINLVVYFICCGLYICESQLPQGPHEICKCCIKTKPPLSAYKLAYSLQVLIVLSVQKLQYCRWYMTNSMTTEGRLPTGNDGTTHCCWKSIKKVRTCDIRRDVRFVAYLQIEQAEKINTQVDNKMK